ncbi:hypothetical protein ACOMHN_021801 [Nucella lapillus]
MGGSQSSHHQAERRWSFPTEIPLAPEACWELYRGWQIFHIDIELETLPPHLRHKILNRCVDDYTQEVIPRDGKQKAHLCFQNQCVDEYMQEIIPGDGTDGKQKTHLCFSNHSCGRPLSASLVLRSGSSVENVCPEKVIRTHQRTGLQRSHSSVGTFISGRRGKNMDEVLFQQTNYFPRKDYMKKTLPRGLWTFPDSSVNISPFTKTKACDKFPGRRRSTPSFPTGLMAGRSHSQARKPGWKEEPGWIPNPLDSDSSDQDEPEESEAFCVSAQLSKRSSNKDPASIDPLDHSPGMGLSDRKEAAKLSERRRCYSEPSSGRSSGLSVEFPILKDNSGDDHHSDVSSPDTGAGWTDTPQSKWNLWRRRRRSKAQSVDDDASLPPPANEDEESRDLEKELEWLVADPEKTLSTQDVESSNDTTTTVLAKPKPPEPSACPQGGQTTCGGGSGEWGEVEWLCEPEWNNLEMEVFWGLLRPHLEHLLRVEVPGEDLLPLPRVYLSSMDASDHTMMDRCLLHVQRHIWTGNYRQAVADFRAVLRHFRSCAEKSGLLQCAVKNDVEVLRLVFFRKRPTRYRLWI